MTFIPSGDPIKTVGPEDSPFDAEGFVGVSPEYQTYANKTDKPLEDDADDDAEDDTEATDDGAARTAGAEATVPTGDGKGTTDTTAKTGTASKTTAKPAI